MSPSNHELGRLQRWMQAVIMHPGGVADALESSEARAHCDVPTEQVEDLVERSRQLTAIERLSIYSGAYYARLLECLREDCPVLVHALGQELFDEFAVGYLQRYPSRSYTLNRLGSNFARYLAETRPPEELGENGDWPAFLIDLAMLESAYNEVFDGPGVEGVPLLEPTQLLAIPPLEWPEARLVFVDCFRLMAFHFPVHEYYRAVRRGKDPAPPAPAETYLAITRSDYVVRRNPLSRTQFRLLEELRAGRPLGAAICTAAVDFEVSPDSLVDSLREWFRGWSANGFFRAVMLPAGLA